MPVRLPQKGMNFFRPAMAVEVGFRPGYSSRAGRALAGLGNLGDGPWDFIGTIAQAVGPMVSNIATAINPAGAIANSQAQQAQSAAYQAQMQAQADMAQAAQTKWYVLGGVVVAGIAAFVLTRK